MTAPVADWSEIRFRADTVRAGARLAAFTVAAGAAYAGVTWDQPRRSLLLALFGGMALIATLLTRLPIERLVRTQRREVFFFAWSLVSIGLAAAAVAADGGGSTPLVLLFFPPLVFAALSYPLWSVVVLSAFTELAFVTTSAIGAADPAPVAFSAAALGMTAVLCAWQAQTHERRRQELADISRADPLTGCLNRRGFEEQLRAELDEGTRTGQPLTILTLDLNDFKRVNDTHGHAAGDELLCWTVAQLVGLMRSTDSIGRMGGDEFALLLRGASSIEGAQAAERIRATLSDRISAAVGLASFPTDGIDEPELLRHADAALYASKERRPPEQPTARRDLSWAAVMARAVDLRTGDEHSQQVARLAGAIAEELDWDQSDVMLLRIAAMLHDLGKVSISDGILRKPSTLSAQEYDQVKRHTEVGAELVARVEGLEPIVPWVRHANERYDGTGYPDGLAGEAIPPAARILLSADAFVAMTSHRPYRLPMEPADALAEMQRCAGTQFDPASVTALEQVLTAESMGDPPAATRSS
jgi:diguanylate cyclase (GGDEF)-like protein/putative nucleotidyltransferase with HDIG domain